MRASSSSHTETCTHTHTWPAIHPKQRKRQVSLHLSLNFSLRLAPPLSPRRDLCRAIAPVSRIQIIASSYSPPGNGQNNKVTSYPHVLFALIPPPLIGFTPSRHPSSSFFLHLSISVIYSLHAALLSVPLHLRTTSFHFYTVNFCKTLLSITPILHLCAIPFSLN